VGHAWAWREAGHDGEYSERSLYSNPAYSSGVAGEKRERTRRRLVEAAFEVVAERGFHAASVDLIAQRADLSTGALYANFENKDALLLAAFEEHVRWFERSLEAAATAPDLREGISAWAQALEAEPEQFLVFIEFWAYAVRRDELRAELTDRLDGMRAALTSEIDRRADGTDGLLSPDLAARVVLALARGLAFDVVANPGSAQTETITGLLAALVSTDTPG
jgi:AcrR family transcriptional regulator